MSQVTFHTIEPLMFASQYRHNLLPRGPQEAGGRVGQKDAQSRLSAQHFTACSLNLGISNGFNWNISCGMLLSPCVLQQRHYSSLQLRA